MTNPHEPTIPPDNILVTMPLNHSQFDDLVDLLRSGLETVDSNIELAIHSKMEREEQKTYLEESRRVRGSYQTMLKTLLNDYDTGHRHGRPRMNEVNENDESEGYTGGTC